MRRADAPPNLDAGLPEAGGPLERLDGFPFRHRVEQAMTPGVATVSPDTTVGAAARRLVDGGSDSLVVVDGDGRTVGIVTERDIVRALARDGSGSGRLPLAEVMSAPVATVAAHAYLFVAFGRMRRLGIRHLLVVDDDERPVGMVSLSLLGRFRVGRAFAIGDGVACARNGGDLARVWGEMPALLGDLLAEGLAPGEIADIVGSVLRDVVARAVTLAEAAVLAEGGSAPGCAWAMLAIGSAGRGEATLVTDQDHAIVYDGDGDAEDEARLAAIAGRTTEILAEAGIRRCPGGVMASSPDWRRTLVGWRREFDLWRRKADGPALLNADIFIDFAVVHGDRTLGQRLRRDLNAGVGRSAPFLRALASSLNDMPVPLGLFGELVTLDGRLSIKKSGLLPLVSTVRILAFKHRIDATGTRDRIRLLRDAGFLPPDDARRLDAAYEVFLDVLFRQFVRDRERGLALSYDIAPDELDAETRARLRAGFRYVRSLKRFVDAFLSSV